MSQYDKFNQVKQKIHIEKNNLIQMLLSLRSNKNFLEQIRQKASSSSLTTIFPIHAASFSPSCYFSFTGPYHAPTVVDDSIILQFTNINFLQPFYELPGTNLYIKSGQLFFQIKKQQNTFFISSVGQKNDTKKIQPEYGRFEATSFHRLYRNKQFLVELRDFNQLYSLSDRIVKFELEEKCPLVLLLKKEEAQARRVLIYRRKNTQGQDINNQQRYNLPYLIYTGYYSSSDIKQYVTLEAGEYLLVPEIGTELSIYSTQKIFMVFADGSREEQEQNQLNLMLQGFSQCQLKQIKCEFTRNCYFNLGIIIQTYLNMQEQEIIFEAQNNGSHQDKTLMFKSFYKKDDGKVRLKKGQLTIEFYRLSKKPAFISKNAISIKANKQQLKTKTIHLNIK